MGNKKIKTFLNFAVDPMISPLLESTIRIMAKRSRENAMKALEDQIKEMEKLGFHGETQKDWEDDADDPIEKAMATKDIYI
ncbi:hypothetical protein Avbf_12074 [Armadillidium vulgare]|nr:hypothetical protein Avbf_12074 [Armadillidium vulgare]